MNIPQKRGNLLGMFLVDFPSILREKERLLPRLKSTTPCRPPLPRTTTFLILGRILTASTLPGFINRWANTFFPYPSQVLDNLTSLINHMESFNHMVSIILYHLSSPPFITETQGRPCLVHTILNERLTSRFALIEDFQDLIQECEKRVYSCADIPQGTYVEMQRGNQSSIGCEMGMLVLRELARRERTRRFEADLKIWILNTGKWMEDGMKVVEQEEKRVKGEQWILEEDDWFWQDDLYRPME